MTGPQPGYCIGDERAPDAYVLRRLVRVGGEGVVWQATSPRQNGRADHLWAVKIVHPYLLLDSDDNETLGSARKRWHDRLSTALDEIAQIRDDVPGIVGPAKVFLGDEPHPPGMSTDGKTLYVLTRWIEGSDLGRWRQTRAPSFAEICMVLGKLAAIVDGLASRAVIHRDISPGNVMVGPDGQVSLIDWTFTRPPDSAAGTVVVRNRGYTAPEARIGRAGAAADRYSFGGVAYYLLSRMEPAIEDAAAECQAVLMRDGSGAAVADHVAALLHAEPGERPQPLSQWAKRLRELGRRDAVSTRYRALALSIDGTATPLVTAASAGGVSMARLGVGLSWRLAPDPASPAAVVALATVTDGSGAQVIFAVDESGTAHLCRDGRWSALGRVDSGAGIAAIRDPRGRATAYLVDPADHDLATITVGLDGIPRRVATGRPVSRVLSATTDRDGSAMILVQSPGGDLACISAEGISRVGEGSAIGAVGCIDRWGGLRCYRITAGRRALWCFDRTTGEWGPGTTVEAPIAATAVACAGHRQGVTVALAGDGGLQVATQGDKGFGPWHALTDKPCSQVALDTGAAWRLRLAALVQGRVVLAAEDFNGGWAMGLTTL